MSGPVLTRLRETVKCPCCGEEIDEVIETSSSDICIKCGCEFEGERCYD